MQTQKGFSLIELMIVVAIIGILAAVAIPQYQNYVARSQASGALSEISGARTAYEEITLRGGTVSLTQGDAGFVGVTAGSSGFGTIGLVSGDIGGEDFEGIEIELDGNVAGVIENGKIQLQRDQNGQWRCHTDDIPDQFIPGNCIDGDVL